MKKTQYKPKDLYIYTEFPDPTFVDPRKICTSYKATCDAITKGDEEVHTLQIVFLSHLWIKAGYNIHLRDGKFEYIFDQNWMNQNIPTFPATNQYFLLEHYRWGLIGGWDEE